jgi:hypothetical protein
MAFAKLKPIVFSFLVIIPYGIEIRQPKLLIYLAQVSVKMHY